MNPHVLALIQLPRHTVQALGEEYTLSYQPDAGAAPVIDDTLASGTVAVVTNGTTGCSGALMDRLPALKTICSFGAGYEKVDVEAARARCIAVTHAPGANAATVADHAIGFALALARGYCGLSAAVKAGRWKQSRGERTTLNGSTVGIIGMGRVGQLIAKRAAAFDATVAYFDLAPRQDVPARFVPNVADLAEASDFLIAACPGGKSTHHLVNRTVLTKLGPAGYVINVSRGTVLDTADLVSALRDGIIAGAGLDVLEEEPEVPHELAKFDNVLLTPHVAGRSPASFVAQKDALMQSLSEALGGKPCTYLVPELRGTR
jgi:lactate dehydrogenase-like 2-hydroxyacid dehydrogenase